VQATTKNSRAKRRTLSVLIADDNQDVVLTLAEILTDEGHLVHTCTDGKQAIDAIRRHKPQVCILDIAMPGMTGYEVARQIEKSPAAERPTLIGISGQFTKPGDKLLAKSVGFRHFLAKPADPDLLIRMLESIAGEHS